MPTMKRSFRSTTRCAYRALVAAALLTLPACGPLAYAGYRIAPDYPRDEKQTVDLPGLHDPVLVVLDKGGIPHIQAQNEEDLLRAVGFAQARSRFFQMDMMRRFSQGRLSELVGDQKLLSSSTIEFDVAMRGWGFGKGGDQDAASLSPSSRRSPPSTYFFHVTPGIARRTSAIGPRTLVSMLEFSDCAAFNRRASSTSS